MDPPWKETIPMPEGYATGRATKQSIVESAAAAFAQKGFYGASLRSIAREAGVDHSTLLHHFGNKTALLLAVIEWHDSRSMPEELPETIDAEYIADGFAATAARNAETPGLVQLLSVLTAEAGAENHPARETLQRRHGLVTALIAWTIRTQRAEHEGHDDDLSPEDRAAVVVASWEGLQVYDALHPGQLDVPALVRAMLRDAFLLD
ncbi:helix-turn-helix domain-containing protein [Demequina sp. SYSU T00192]|uniref:Helix-turn-helix domain-containing protein n=1 Tax=Demequina litoralis TaxID=3051660 RepID=A0ABT8GBA5_9MICO|nr:TetR/AcrR family transcriptional regulator [Demequina sp. SYSU T00192]MDN4476259.1 helix-turn-helix domain-containing protein [Demequina sp. SYSU T00192]